MSIYNLSPIIAPHDNVSDCIFLYLLSPLPHMSGVALKFAAAILVAHSFVLFIQARKCAVIDCCN